MSKQNVETVRRWIDAYNRRDFECLIGLNDPDFEFRSFVSIESVFRSTEAFPYAYFKTLDEATPSFQVATCAYFPMGTSWKVPFAGPRAHSRLASRGILPFARCT